MYDKIGLIVLDENSILFERWVRRVQYLCLNGGIQCKWSLLVLSYLQGGPCGVLACVQAYVLKYLLFSDSAKNHTSKLVNACTLHVII